mgnify:FL=1
MSFHGIVYHWMLYEIVLLEYLRSPPHRLQAFLLVVLMQLFGDTFVHLGSYGSYSKPRREEFVLKEWKRIIRFLLVCFDGIWCLGSWLFEFFQISTFFVSVKYYFLTVLYGFSTFIVPPWYGIMFKDCGLYRCVSNFVFC